MGTPSGSHNHHIEKRDGSFIATFDVFFKDAGRTSSPRTMSRMMNCEGAIRFAKKHSISVDFDDVIDCPTCGDDFNKNCPDCKGDFVVRVIGRVEDGIEIERHIERA